MRKVQIIKCKCGAVFAAACTPHCYEDAEWQRDMRKYVKQGHTVDLIDSDAFDGLQECVCKETELKSKKAIEPTLFD